MKEGTEFPHLLESSVVAALSLSHVLVLCDPTDDCTPGSSVLYYLPEFAQIRVH